MHRIRAYFGSEPSNVKAVNYPANVPAPRQKTFKEWWSEKFQRTTPRAEAYSKAYESRTQEVYGRPARKELTKAYKKEAKIEKLRREGEIRKKVDLKYQKLQTDLRKEYDAEYKSAPSFAKDTVWNRYNRELDVLQRMKERDIAAEERNYDFEQRMKSFGVRYNLR
jgi:hypothetical protein